MNVVNDPGGIVPRLAITQPQKSTLILLTLFSEHLLSDTNTGIWG